MNETKNQTKIVNYSHRHGMMMVPAGGVEDGWVTVDSRCE